jgi:hypothetical protein
MLSGAPASLSEVMLANKRGRGAVESHNHQDKAEAIRVLNISR